MIELLVTIAVMAILVVMLFGMVDAAAKLWKDNENRVDAYREARAALNVISSDLRAMLASTNTNYFATNAVGSVPADIVPNEGIFFLTTLPATAQPSDNKGEICTAGYYRRWTKQNVNFGGTSGSDPTVSGYHLFRTFYGSDTTYSNLIAASAQPLKDLAQPADPTTAELLARNIVSLEFRYYETNAPGNAQLKAWTRTTTNPLPQMIEVRLTALSDDFAKRLASDKTRWVTNDTYISNNMRTFVSRVQLPRLSGN